MWHVLFQAENVFELGGITTYTKLWLSLLALDNRSNAACVLWQLNERLARRRAEREKKKAEEEEARKKQEEEEESKRKAEQEARKGEEPKKTPDWPLPVWRLFLPLWVTKNHHRFRYRVQCSCLLSWSLVCPSSWSLLWWYSLSCSLPFFIFTYLIVYLFVIARKRKTTCPCACSLLCWCPLSTSKHVKIKQINIVTFTIFFLTIVIFVFYLAWLCYETREDCHRRWSVRGETEGNCVVSSARTHQCWNEVWTRENSTRGNGKSIYLWPRPHYGEKMWERRLHSDNVSNVFCPHYAGEI